MGTEDRPKDLQSMVLLSAGNKIRFFDIIIFLWLNINQVKSNTGQIHHIFDY